jgi:hypothetical protein
MFHLETDFSCRYRSTVEICRAAELSKERIKTLETPSASGLEVHAVKHKTRHTPQQNRQPQRLLCLLLTEFTYVSVTVCISK